MFLNDEDLQFLTGAGRRDARVRALRATGIEHRVRPDGRTIVLRSHVEELLGARPKANVHSMEPDWSAVRASPSKA